MTNEITTQKQEVMPVSEETIRNYLLSSGNDKKLSKEQQNLFLNIALRNGLDPFKKEIYAVPFEIKEKGEGTGKYNLSIIIGYQVWLQRARQSKLLDRWRVQTIEENGKLKGARIEIWRKDAKGPFEREVDFDEFCVKFGGKPSGNWESKPKFMIKKVAIGQGFKLCFPELIQGDFEYDPIDNEPEYINIPEEKSSSEILNDVVDEIGSTDISDGLSTQTYLSELSSEEITKEEYEYSKRLYGYALTREEQTEFKKRSAKSVNKTKAEIFEEMKKELNSTDKTSQIENTDEEPLPF